MHQDLTPRATNATEAHAIIAEAIAALDELQPIIQDETDHLKDGRVSGAFHAAERKSKAALRYQRALEAIKANAVAMGRFQPTNLSRLQTQHETFAEILALNMAVLGTAKTVSESIIRELAQDVGRTHAPQGYGQHGQAPANYRAAATPLAISKAC
jgi:hypothetical protein